MYRTINKVQLQSEDKRKKTALMVSGGITFVIAALWLITLPMRLNSPNVTVVATEAGDEMTGPFSTFVNSVKNSAEFAWGKRSSASAGEILNSDYQSKEDDRATDFEAVVNSNDSSEVPAFLPITKLEFLP